MTNQIHLEFGSDDETDGGDDDVEVEKPEEALVLEFQDDFQHSAGDAEAGIEGLCSGGP